MNDDELDDDTMAEIVAFTEWQWEYTIECIERYANEGREV